MRIHQDDTSTTVNDPLVVLLDQRQRQQEAKHYNPLRMLELLAKGFCPTILRDRDEIHVILPSSEPHNNIPNVACPSPSEHVVPPPPGQIHTSTLEPSSITNTNTTSSSSGSGSGKASRMDKQQHYFEIGERPPANVIEISKKLWDNFCRGPYNNNHPGHPPHAHAHLLQKGFCAIVNDYWCHNSTTMNNNEHEVAPDGEECSVYSEATVDVDLSPQSSPCLPLQLPDCDTLENDGLEEEEEEEQEEEIPIAEFLHPDQRNTWRLQVLVTTCLALFITLWLLATTTTDNGSFHFALTRKQDHNSLFFLSIHSKQGDVCLTTSQNLVDVPAIVSKEEETDVKTTNGTF